jgi:hypothetical protein
MSPNLRLPLILVSVPFLYAVGVQAQESNDITMMMGSGIMARCGEWTDDRKHDRELELAQWSMGFVSASNVWNHVIHGNDLLKDNTDAYALVGWLDNYCKAHPLERFPNAVMSFIGTIRQQRNGRR